MDFWAGVVVGAVVAVLTVAGIITYELRGWL